MDSKNKPGTKRLMAIGAVNGTIIGGGLALTHNPYWLPLGVGIAAFITFDLRLCEPSGSETLTKS